MGGAQPLAATMNGAVALVAEVDPERIEKRLNTRYLDERETDLDRAIDRALAARAAKKAVSIGVEANAVDLLERLLGRGVLPELVTDQTSAHDELNGYVPRGGSLADLERLRAEDPKRYIDRAYATMADHVRALLELQRRGSVVFDYGNNLRGQAQKAGVADAFKIGGFVPLYIRPLFCEGKGPFRWAALSGDPEDIRSDGPGPPRALSAGSRRWRGGSSSPRSASLSRACRRGSAGSATARGTARACSSTTSCGRARCARRSSSAATISTPDPSRRPTARRKACATVPTRSPTGRSSMRSSTRPPARRGFPFTTAAASESDTRSTPAWWSWPTGPRTPHRRLERVLKSDPGTGVMRHADAGYPEAIAAARERGVDLPFLR